MGVMVFAFSSHAILGSDCATRVISALPPMDDDTRFCVRVCLHEALYNAALHGNLELMDIHHSGITKQVQDRLDDPRLGSRPVFVTCDATAEGLSIVVKDFGDPEVSLPTEDRGHGVGGLTLIRRLTEAMSFDPKVKELTMRFCWKEAI